MGKRKSSTVEQWQKDGTINRARQAAGVTPDQIPDQVILSLIAVESGGDDGAWDKRGTKARPVMSQFVGLLQQGTAVSKDLKKTSPPPGKHIVGTPVSPSDPRYSQAKNYPLSYYLRYNGELAISEFCRLQKKYSKTTDWNPELMAIVWKGGIGTAGRFKEQFRKGGSKAAIDYLKRGSPYVNKKGETKKVPGVDGYLERFQAYMKAYDGDNLLGVEFEEGAAIDDSNNFGTTANVDTISGITTQTFEAKPFELSNYITPEELRKGIIAEVFYLSDWHLAQLSDPESKANDEEKVGSTSNTDRLIEEAGQESANEKRGVIGARGDTASDRRSRYAASIVESEFYNRRFAARSVPASTGPFNPYPIAGFPGLIMTPGRPIIGYVTNVTHQISVAGGSGTTGVSMVSPRYWDEGEVWYWLGGEAKDQDIQTEALWRRFPQWHNRKTVATNHFDGDPTDGSSYARKLSELDKYYLFMLGTGAVEYYSNNTGKVDAAETVIKAIEERNPSDLDVNPETLEILEYNKLIAETDENGEFAPGTLAHKFYGSVKPYSAIEHTATVEQQIEYTERYGVREYELFVDFLGNRFKKEANSGRVCLVGPTYGDTLNSLQRQVLAYMDDLETRRIEGGV